MDSISALVSFLNAVVESDGPEGAVAIRDDDGAAIYMEAGKLLNVVSGREIESKVIDAIESTKGCDPQDPLYNPVYEALAKNIR